MASGGGENPFPVVDIAPLGLPGREDMDAFMLVVLLLLLMEGLTPVKVPGALIGGGIIFFFF